MKSLIAVRKPSLDVGGAGVTTDIHDSEFCGVDLVTHHIGSGSPGIRMDRHTSGCCCPHSGPHSGKPSGRTYLAKRIKTIELGTTKTPYGAFLKKTHFIMVNMVFF